MNFLIFLLCFATEIVTHHQEQPSQIYTSEMVVKSGPFDFADPSAKGQGLVRKIPIDFLPSLDLTTKNI